MAVGGTGGPKSDINMTPMIDVLLVLIIIFMVITPLTPKGLEALVPQPPPPNQPPNTSDVRTVVIVIDKDHKYAINQDPVAEADLGTKLTDIFKTRAEKIAFVKGDDNVRFADVARAIDIMRASGIDSVGLITAKMESGG